MPLIIERNDITKLKVDAIVNAANESLLGGGGVDGAIHRAAGPALLAECRTLHGCKTGQAKLTRGYNLPAKYVIHTVGPIWQGGHKNEKELLASCYRESLKIAKEQGFATVAFPLISAGVYGYPKAEAIRVALDTIGSFLMEEDEKGDMTVTLVIFDRKSFALGNKLVESIREYIDDHYVEEFEARDFRRFGGRQQRLMREEVRMPSIVSGCAPAPSTLEKDLEALIRQTDAGFSETLLKLIDASGKKDSEIYKKANVDRKLFSKIRTNPDYKPSKTTAVAFALALQLDADAAQDLIGRAGYTFSPSSKFDLVVRYFMEQGIYDVILINEMLFAFDLPLMGNMN